MESAYHVQFKMLSLVNHRQQLQHVSKGSGKMEIHALVVDKIVSNAQAQQIASSAMKATESNQVLEHTVLFVQLDVKHVSHYHLVQAVSEITGL
jgi:hypothetical protein